MEGEEPDQFYSVEQLLMEEGLMQHTTNTEQPQNHQHITSRRQLKLDHKRMIVDDILLTLQQGILPRGALSKLATKHGVHRTTITRILADIMKQKERGELIDVRTKKLGRTGPKPKQYSEQWLQSVPLKNRTTERKYAAALGLPKITIHRLKKRGIIRTHTSSNHPALNDNHKVARLQWVLSHLTPATPTQKATFVNMQNVIHVDEKWFYLSPETRRFYLLPKEEDPYRCQQSKRFKIKAMFMAIIGPPIYDANGFLIHDGKYGIFPFVFKQTAKRSSKNRQAGTEETKAIQNITKGVVREMLINNVIPAIIAKWPPFIDKQIYLQWDNAKPHVIPTDEEFVAATTQQGFNITMVYQPPQSPDLNVLDLGLFRSIQSLQYEHFPKNLDELIEKVEEAYNSFDPSVNKYIWLTLQLCMIEILKKEGGNNYRLPHMGKERLDRQGMLPERLEVNFELVEATIKYLNDRFRPSNQGRTENEMEVDAD